MSVKLSTRQVLLINPRLRRKPRAAQCSLVTRKIVIDNGRKFVYHQDRPPILGEHGDALWKLRRQNARVARESAK